MTDEATPQRLVKELEQLTRSRSPAELVRDASGLFVPGFTAFPAVTLVPAKPSRTATQPERMRTGELFSFDVDYSSSEQKRGLLTFFTPMADITIPPVYVNMQPPKGRSLVTLTVESKAGLENTELCFAWIPWSQDEADQAARIEAISRYPELANVVAANLRAFIAAEGAEIPLHPRWGLPDWVPDFDTESIVFPVSYARKVIAPFFFRIRLEPSYTLPGGRSIQLRQRSITLSFSFPEAALDRLYGLAGIGMVRANGFQVIGNAVPMMNADLKAWEPDVTFADFIATSNMRTLGFAGTVTFKQHGPAVTGALDSVASYGLRLPHTTQFSLAVGKDGRIVSRYALPDVVADADNKQLLFWMTHGAELNGIKFRYTESERIQPMHVTSQTFRQVTTAVPCFGGYDCARESGGELYESLMLSYAAPPQMLLYGDSLIFLVRDLLSRLGYGDHEVIGPSTEMRIMDGGRRRVTVVYVMNKIGNPVRPDDLEVIQDYLDQRAPLGSRILLDLR